MHQGHVIDKRVFVGTRCVCLSFPDFEKDVMRTADKRIGRSAHEGEVDD
jgi:hypothetical protein